MGGTLSKVPAKLWTASPICLRLLEHWMRAAASRTFCTAGSSRPMRTAMMAMTTSSSISVNAERREALMVSLRVIGHTTDIAARLRTNDAVDGAGSLSLSRQPSNTLRVKIVRKIKDRPHGWSVGATVATPLALDQAGLNVVVGEHRVNRVLEGTLVLLP